MTKNIEIKKNSFFEDIILTAGIGFGFYLLLKKAKENNIELFNILPSRLPGIISPPLDLDDKAKKNTHDLSTIKKDDNKNDKKVAHIVNNEYRGFYGYSSN